MNRARRAILVGVAGLAILAGCAAPTASLVRTDAGPGKALERVYVYSFTHANVLSDGVSGKKFLAAIEQELARRGVYAKAIDAIRSGKKAGMVVYRDRSNFSDGSYSVSRSTIPIEELIALHAEDEKRDGITHRITLVPRVRGRSGSLIAGNFVDLSVGVYAAGGQKLARGSLYYQYRLAQDERELARLLMEQLEEQGFVRKPAVGP